MVKPVFFILFCLHGALSVVAQNEMVLADTADRVVRNNTGQFGAVQKLKPIAVRVVPQKMVDSLKAADEFWYANAELVKKKKKGPEGGESLFRKKWFRNLLWVVILSSFIGVVVWYLVASNILIFRKGAKQIDEEAESGKIHDDIFSIQYEKEIAAATAAADYRLAIRLWYLQTLKLLSEKGLIHYQFGRTNQDYVAQLSQHSLYRHFFRLTRNFEYTWYGQFPLSAEAYAMMQADFVQFQNSLHP